MRYLYIRKLVNFIYPARCMFCRRDFDDERRLLVCPDCLRLYENRGISRIPLPGEALACDYALDYRDEVRSALLRFKFSGMPQYARGLAHFLLPALEAHMNADFISWTPVSALRRICRGYDQSRMLAAQLSRSSGIPMMPTLRKRRHNRQQSLLDATQRFENVRGAYHPLHAERIHGARIILLDDIVTTGATLCECVATLKDAGAAEVICLALAHGAGGKEK